MTTKSGYMVIRAAAPKAPTRVIVRHRGLTVTSGCKTCASLRGKFPVCPDCKSKLRKPKCPACDNSMRGKLPVCPVCKRRT